MDPVEFIADVLPTRFYQNISFEVDNPDGHTRDRKKIIHQGLDQCSIYDIGKILFIEIHIRRKNRIKFEPEFFFAFPQCIFPSPFFSNVMERTDGCRSSTNRRRSNIHRNPNPARSIMVEHRELIDFR